MAKTFVASHRGARINPTKARPVIDLVRGRPVQEALNILEFEPRRAAPMIRKVIRSAMANASNDLDVNLSRLVVVDARIDGGGLLQGRRRWRHRARGQMMPILKQVSHISVALAEAEKE